MFRVAGLYILGAWAALQASDLAFPGLGIHESAIRYVWIVAFAALPISLFVGWRYDVLGGHIVRTADSEHTEQAQLQRIDYLILSSLAAVSVALLSGLLLALASEKSLEMAVPSAVAVDPRSVAVLPFTAMTPAENDEYFADGLSEELLNSLVGVSGLKVPGRPSSFYFKGKDEDLRSVGAKLGVAHVLVGSVRRSGETLRISVQLVQVSDGFHVWSDTYDREADDILEIQTEIATEVVRALQGRFLGELVLPDLDFGTDSPEARNNFLIAKARYRRNVSTMAPSAEYRHVRTTRELLEEVTSLDPDYADAWALLARTLLKEAAAPSASGEPRPSYREATDRALAAIESAESLSPESAEILLAKAEVAYWLYRRGSTGGQTKADVIAAYEAAIAAAPENVDVLEAAAAFFDINDRADRALELYDAILLLEPLAEVRLSRAVLLSRSDPARAYRELLTVRDLYPDSGWANVLGFLETGLGHYHHALALGEDTPTYELRPYLFASLGDPESALAAISRGAPEVGMAQLALREFEFRLRRDYEGQRAWLNSENVVDSLNYFARICVFGLETAYYLREWDLAAAIVDDCLARGDPAERGLIYGTDEGRKLAQGFRTDMRIKSAIGVAMAAYVLDHSDRGEEANRLWDWASELLDSATPGTLFQQNTIPHMRALILAGQGDAGGALDQLETMYASGWRGPMMGWWDKVVPSNGDLRWFEDNPMFDGIRDEPRFVSFVEMVRKDNANMLAQYRDGLSFEEIVQEDLNAFQVEED